VEKKLLIPTWTIILLLLSPPVWAGTYYCNSSTGNDSWNGLYATYQGGSNGPWATIDHALETISIDGGHTIWIADGTYDEFIWAKRSFTNPVYFKAENPYKVVLTNSNCNTALFLWGVNQNFQGVRITSSNSSACNVEGLTVKELMWFWRCDDCGLYDVVMHDSLYSDLISVQGGSNITIDGCMFYNTQGWDEEIDINFGANGVYVQDSIFFRDYEGSGRSVDTQAQSFIIVKSSDVNEPNPPTRNVYIRRNIFMNHEGYDWGAIFRIGEDGHRSYEAQDVTFENNLVLMDNFMKMGNLITLTAADGVTVRANTFIGDFDSSNYFLLRTENYGSNNKSREVYFYNNILADTDGGMPRFTYSPSSQITSAWELDNNLYYNGDASLPTNDADEINYSDDSNRIVDDPDLTDNIRLQVPRWTGPGFQGGYGTIAEAFRDIVTTYGVPASGSPVTDAANANNMPSEDILGNPRPGGGGYDIGAYESQGITSGPPPPPTDLRIISVK
jgi:hypothetical protein